MRTKLSRILRPAPPVRVKSPTRFRSTVVVERRNSYTCDSPISPPIATAIKQLHISVVSNGKDALNILEIFNSNNIIQLVQSLT